MKKIQIKIETDFIKLDQLLKFSDLSTSGGESKIWIEQGWVKVNGEVATQRGKKIYPNYVVRVSVEGQPTVEIKVV